MKKVVTISALMLLIAGVASAANLGTSGSTAPQQGSYTPPLVPVTITQNLDTTTILSGNSVSCNNGVSHTDNAYLRRFDLFVDHAITDVFSVMSVDWAVEISRTASNPNPQPADVNLYSIPWDAAFTYANMTMVGTATALIAVDGTMDGMPVNTVVAGSVTSTAASAQVDHLVVEIDHAITDVFSVMSVDWAVEISRTASNPNPQPADVNLYSIPWDAAFTYANMTMVGTATALIAVDGTMDGMPVNTVVAGSVTSTGGGLQVDHLVVEIFTPDGEIDGYAMWIGSNDGGEIEDSYLVAVDCGISEPTAVGAIGFPTMHVIMMVNGDTDAPPTPTEETHWGTLKSLYQ
mgnify:CR=1 FL=1